MSQEAVELLMAADTEKFAVKQKDKEGNLVLHSACEHKKPNEVVIRLLMEAFPEGLKEKDKEGNLPLHSALEVGDEMPVSIIKEMLDLYPGACLVKDKEKNTLKSYFEMTYATIVRINEDVKDKTEMEKIILRDLQNKIAPDLEKSFLDVLHNSGYKNVKFQKKLDFDKLYNEIFN